MSIAIGNGQTLRGYQMEDWSFTFNLASTIVKADEGKVVALDTTAPNTVKLAGDNDYIIGILFSVENRTQEGTLVGTVELKFAEQVATTGVVAVGDTLVGSLTAGVGRVRQNAGATANESDFNANYVVEVGTNTAVIVKG